MRWPLDVRRALVGLTASALIAGAGALTRLPSTSEPERADLARPFDFAVSDLNGDPPGARSLRQVQPALEHIRAWISAVGAGVGLADLDGDGRANEYCLVDPRDDSVTVAPAPDAAGRFSRFALQPGGLRYDRAITAPMGCLPADLNEDGATDVLVYFWGRAPIAYLRDPRVRISAGTAAFRPTDIVAEPTELWNSTTANVADLDGDGRLDLFVGNYFPDGARVLDVAAADDPLMRMQSSMSLSPNAGTNRILRLAGVVPDPTGGPARPRYSDASGALTPTQSRSWTLATGAQDLDGDSLPEFYIANDFGPDTLLHNRSTPGRIRFTELRGYRDVRAPKSKVIGYDSFKSMGVAFSDLNNDGRQDILVSNITTEFGLEESNFAFVSRDIGPLTDGRAPYRDESERLGVSRTGWAWDIKAADFDGDGTDEIVQALGFVAGHTNRWADLQELALTNDEWLQYPWAWPKFRPGDDIAGHQRDPFFVRGPEGRFVDLAAELDVPLRAPSRGLAIGDVDHDGRPDLLVAKQWGRSLFLHNRGPERTHLGLRLLLPASTEAAAPRPALGATVTVSTADGRVQEQQLYPGNGHTGANAAELLFGLGRASGPVDVTVRWRDAAGQHTTSRTLTPGWHDLVLDPRAA